jgi:vacuolar protein sorting-associated protein IST1
MFFFVGSHPSTHVTILVMLICSIVSSFLTRLFILFFCGSRYSDDEYDSGDTMQFEDAALATRAAAKSAERAASAAKVAADFANKTAIPI